MQFKIAERFKIADVQRFDDPWGLGMWFMVRRMQSTNYPAIIAEKQKPLVQQIKRKAYKAGMAQAVKGDMDVSEDRMLEMVLQDLEVSEDLDIDGDLHEPGDVATELLDGWGGVTTEDGEQVPFSIEAATEFLSQTAPLDSDVIVDSKLNEEGEEEAILTIPRDSTLGFALITMLVYWSGKNDNYRDEYLKGVRGN
jgi:hypothetical protein